MKKELVKGLTMVMAVVVFALATAIASNAQSSNRVVADIPFEFSVGYKSMPAGEYNVRTLTNGNALMVQSADAKTSAVRLTAETDRSKNTSARLVFHRYGERYFLAEVWNGIDRAGRQLLKSSEERSIEKEFSKIAANGEAPKNSCEKIEIVAALR